MGEVEGVRCVVTGVHIEDRGYGRLTIARIDGKEIETRSFDRGAEDAKGNAR